MYNMSNFVGFSLLQLCKILHLQNVSLVNLIPNAGICIRNNEKSMYSRWVERRVWRNGRSRCHSLNICEIDRDNVDTVKSLSPQHDLYHPTVDACFLGSSDRQSNQSHFPASLSLYCSTLPHSILLLRVFLPSHKHQLLSDLY